MSRQLANVMSAGNSRFKFEMSRPGKYRKFRESGVVYA
jgi:hypothetical protein